MKKLTIIILTCAFAACAIAATGEIKGQITDNFNEPLEFAMVVLTIQDAKKSTLTDAEGYFSFKPLEPGTYTMSVSYINYKTVILKDIILSDGQVRTLDVEMEPKTLDIDVVIKPVPLDLINLGYPNQPYIMTSTQIGKAPTTDVKDIAAVITPGAYQSDAGGSINFRGSRDDATLYFVDGVKIMGSLGVPQNAIEDLMVISGGMPARYGDSMGGIVVITTKSYKFF